MKRILLFLSIFFFTKNNIAFSQCIPSVTMSGVTNDYITSFSLGTVLFPLGPQEEPCDYTILDSAVLYMPGSSYPFTTNFGASCTNQYFGIWVDLNGDEVLSPSEMVYASSTPSSGSLPLNGNITIPTNATIGRTVLRICTKRGAPVQASESCTLNAEGEYQDYLVFIGSPVNCSGVPVVSNINFLTCPTGGSYNVLAKLINVAPESGYSYEWETADLTDPAFIFPTLIGPPGNSNHPYVFFISSGASGYIRCLVTCLFSGLSDYSPVAVIPIVSFPTSANVITGSEEVKIYPSVFSDYIHVSTDFGEAQTGKLLWYNSIGQLIQQQELSTSSGKKTTTINTSEFASGFYFIKFETKEKSFPPIKVVKVE
jgi:GEVED domain/Secretion system C-terminal sorting domain